MVAINVSEKDFEAAFHGAHTALDAGDESTARALDKLARKINAALSNKTGADANPFGRMAKPATWRDMPSVFAHRT